MQTHIAGIPHRKPDLTKLTVGDPLVLVPEPDNQFDAYAIKVMHDGVHLGYIPRDITQFFHTNKITAAKVHTIQPEVKWKEVILEA